MDLNERKFKKVNSIQMDNNIVNSYYVEKSPLKIIGTYFAEKRLEEQRVRRSLSKEHEEVYLKSSSRMRGNGILVKKKLKESTFRFVSCSKKNNKTSGDNGVQGYSENFQRNYVKRGLQSSPSKLLVLVSNLPTNESTIESINKEINTRRKELIRSYSSEKVDAKLSIYYRKLTNMRNQYQNQLIAKCKKLSRHYSYKDYKLT